MKKLDQADYIVLGKKPGEVSTFSCYCMFHANSSCLQKKMQEIREKDLETITETNFFEMLKVGVPQEKRERMAEEAARRAAEAAQDGEPAKKKQKK